MALRGIQLLRTIRSASLLHHNMFSSSIAKPETEKRTKLKEYRTEDNFVFTEDPDTFGTLSRRLNRDKVNLEDEGDIREEKHVKNTPLPFQQLTTSQYADIIKQYLKHKRLKEAIDVLEVRMKDDRVTPENYIYNILIGACADVGYTKKAFSLYNDMKKRALLPTGDTYTCLFHACSNSPFALDGLKKATNLRELMIEKGVEPNLTNYNAMIKAFGRCGDLATAFKIVDEMVSKNRNVKVHTFNHLIQACISDKENGLRYALMVWRKMLKQREKPNIYSFNLMLKCVKECNMGSKADIEELIRVIQDQVTFEVNNKPLQLNQAKPTLTQHRKKYNSIEHKDNFAILFDLKPKQKENNDIKINVPESLGQSRMLDKSDSKDGTSLESNKLMIKNNDLTVQVVELNRSQETRTVPNLLSKELLMHEVLSLQEVATVQDKFAVIGGQDDFLKEMKAYSVKPDVKTFTQMLPLLGDSIEAENKLLETMKDMEFKADIDFYNMLIKKRCLRSDYEAAFAVKDMIEKESKRRKRKYPLKKKLQLKTNIMTYGVLAMACKTQENADKLLADMKEEQIKVNIEILGTLLRNGTANCDFGYVIHIMKEVKNQNSQVNHIFLTHLEAFKEKCSKIVKSKPRENNDVFLVSYRIFCKTYTDWLKEVNAEEALKPEHPWAQFNETYPETFQRQKFALQEPRKFYKRSRKYIKYVPTVG